jgi:hypothetical protein
MMIAYMKNVARDRAADRGCTGGGEVADDMGPPGEVPRGFSFFWAFRAPDPAESAPSWNHGPGIATRVRD